jgi:hypothetical protein
MKVYRATVTVEDDDDTDDTREIHVTYFAEDMEDAATLALEYIIDLPESPASDLSLTRIADDADEWFERHRRATTVTFGAEDPFSGDKPLGSRPEDREEPGSI